MGMDQYLLIPFLGEWTSIYQLFWCSPGVQGYDTLPYSLMMYRSLEMVMLIQGQFFDLPGTRETTDWLVVSGTWYFPRHSGIALLCDGYFSSSSSSSSPPSHIINIIIHMCGLFGAKIPASQQHHHKCCMARNHYIIIPNLVCFRCLKYDHVPRFFFWFSLYQSVLILTCLIKD